LERVLRGLEKIGKFQVDGELPRSYQGPPLRINAYIAQAHIHSIQALLYAALDFDSK
jgi:hypothetical protein